MLSTQTCAAKAVQTRAAIQTYAAIARGASAIVQRGLIPEDASGIVHAMRVAPSTMTIRPAPVPPSPPFVDQPDIIELRATGIPFSVFAAGHIIHGDVAKQCGEGIVTVFEAIGEGKAWPYAAVGSGLGIVLGGIEYVEARRHDDAAGKSDALRKIFVSCLGVLSNPGLCAGHPALQGGLEAMKIVVGSSTSAPRL